MGVAVENAVGVGDIVSCGAGGVGYQRFITGVCVDCVVSGVHVEGVRAVDVTAKTL